MFVDHIKYVERYIQLEVYKTKILSFLERLETEELKDGRYDLEGDQLYALVQRYETIPLDKARMESHKKYADLQYIYEGEEAIFSEPADNLTVQEDRTPDQDIIFY